MFECVGERLFGRFLELHRPGDPLRLLNAWDAGSAQIFEQRGARAIGTTSAGIAYSLGRPDGERISRTELVEATARIVAAVDVPVTADIESGHGASPEDVEETVRMVALAGAVGINIEDATGDPLNPLRDSGQQARRIEAARRGALLSGSEIFINARIDTCLLNVGSPGRQIEEVLERATAYREAGANGLFVPLASVEVIRRCIAEIDLPLNVLIVSPQPSVDELAELGVARISVGSGPVRAGLGLQAHIASEFLEHGSTAPMFVDSIGYAELNELFEIR